MHLRMRSTGLRLFEQAALPLEPAMRFFVVLRMKACSKASGRYLTPQRRDDPLAVTTASTAKVERLPSALPRTTVRRFVS
jgi:hypothetical protein